MRRITIPLTLITLVLLLPLSAVNCFALTNPQAADPILQWAIEFGDAIFDQSIETTEPLVGICDFAFECARAIIHSRCLVDPPLGQNAQHLAHAVRLKQIVGQMAGNEAVQLVHADRAALANRFPGTSLRHAGVIAMNIAGS